MARQPRPPSPRFGIAEQYGRSYLRLSQQERIELAQVSIDGRHAEQICLPRASAGHTVMCNKWGGICTIRRYQLDQATNAAIPVTSSEGRLRTTCPSRFQQNGMAFEWVGEVLLDDPTPIILDEIGFLRRGNATTDREGVGRIDNILIARDQTHGLNWCALEKQAVYFSGDNMLDDFQAIASHEAQGIPHLVSASASEAM